MTIRLIAASYRYAGSSQPALCDVDLTVEAGGVVGLVGANESGKSTACLVAAGLAPTTIGGHLEGSVTIDGHETRDLPPHALAQRCGALFQNATTQLSGTTRTVFEELAFGPRNLGLPVPEIVRRVEAAMGLLAIGDLAARDPTRLSGGQAQLVALASVLALEPAHLVLDEPTSQLDPHGTRMVGDALARLAAETGTAILLVEHKTDLLERMATEVLALDRGRVVRRGSAGDVLGNTALEDLGIEPPSSTRLRAALAQAGVDLDWRWVSGEAAPPSVVATPR